MKDDRLSLIHISECIERIQKYIRKGKTDSRFLRGLCKVALVAERQTRWT